MPIAVRDLVAGVRAYCGYPAHDILNNATLLLYIHDESDQLRTLLNITDQNFLLERFYIDVNSSTSEYSVDAPVGFGIPILCNTVNDADPQHVTREIPIVTVQDIDLYYIGPRQITGSSVYPHVATSWSFFTEGGQWTAKVTPVHGTPARYQFWYSPARPTPPQLADNYQLLENFTNLLKVSVALKCLPDCLTPTNAEQVKMRTSMLAASKQEYGAAFDLYRRQAWLEQTGPRRSWADDGLYDDIGWMI